ncbi:MAG: septal ring lytic transglycosylase RlpA family protein [Bacteroidota bacterium]
MNNRNLHFLPSMLSFALALGLLFSTQNLSAQTLEGVASFYADRFDGKKTSTGETFHQDSYSAASKELPWGTIVEVTNLANGRKTQVRVNDCGPHSKGRLIDLSKAAARDLDFIKAGEANVRLRIVQTSEAGPTCSRGSWARKLKAQGKSIPPPPAPWDPTKTVIVQPTPTPAAIPPPTVPASSPVPAGAIRGKASYYADRFQGRTTSTGEIYDRRKFTAASKDFPYGTRLEVMNIVNGKKVEVKVNDCGPTSGDRILDLSRAAAERIDLVQAGVAVVQVRVLNMGTQGPTCNRGAWARAQREAAEVTVPLGPGPSSYGTTPVALPAPEMVDAYRVQVGAFGSAKNADNLVAKLREQGYENVYGEASQRLTKVYVGILSNEAAAKGLEADLRKAGYSKASVKSTKVLAEEIQDPVVTYSGTPQIPEPAPAPAVPQFDPTDILFGVQIGAYSSQANADKAMAGLQADGFSSVYSAKVGKMFRVFSGKYYFQNQADELKEKLREAGYEGATVRRVQ